MFKRPLVSCRNCGYGGKAKVRGPAGSAATFWMSLFVGLFLFPPALFVTAFAVLWALTVDNRLSCPSCGFEHPVKLSEQYKAARATYTQGQS